jgi:hypothetical protein
MRDADRYKLLFGPYQMPNCKVGGWLTCEVRGRVKVCAMSNARIQWPLTRRCDGFGRPMLIVTAELARAVRFESNQAVAYWWGVSKFTVTAWRKVLDVPRANDGTHRLHSLVFAEIDTPEVREKRRQSTKRPERNAKISAAKTGRSPSAEVRAKIRAAKLGQKHTEESRRRMSEAQRRRGGNPEWARERPFTANEDAQLGKAPDPQVARQLDRTVWEVFYRRRQLAIPSFRPHRPHKPPRNWRPHEDRRLGTMPDTELALELGCEPRVVFKRRRKLGIPAYGR